MKTNNPKDTLSEARGAQPDVLCGGTNCMTWMLTCVSLGLLMQAGIDSCYAGEASCAWYQVQ